MKCVMEYKGVFHDFINLTCRGECAIEFHRYLN